MTVATLTDAVACEWASSMVLSAAANDVVRDSSAGCRTTAGMVAEPLIHAIAVVPLDTTLVARVAMDMGVSITITEPLVLQFPLRLLRLQALKP